MNKLPIHAPAIRHFCTFQVEHRLYGISLSDVREVSTGLAITPVPHSPSAIRGLANLRSRIYLVLDLRAILGYAPADCTPESRLVILRPGIAESTAILVDRGGGIVSSPEDSIEGAAGSVPGTTADADAPPRFVTGVCKLETDLLMVVASTLLIDHVKSLLAYGIPDRPSREVNPFSGGLS
jgi:chemotaxis signal transduction protein